jgi:uncharacterized protein YydD (DUF2326 family)
MIVSIESSLSTFKAIYFRKGLNILLCERAPQSRDGHTRNSAGKSSLVELINFLMGARADKDYLTRHALLKEHSFFGTFIIGGAKVRIERSGGHPSRVFVEHEGLLDLSLRFDKKAGKKYVTNEEWKAYLGESFFKLSVEDAKLQNKKFTPSFRSLFSYFARREVSGGFLSPERHSEKQARWDWQVNLSYLFGFDWKIPSSLQEIRDRENGLEELKRVGASSPALGHLVGKVSALRPELVLAEHKAAKLREQLGSFQVLPAYREIMDQAVEAKNGLRRLSREIISIRETISYLEIALEGDRPADKKDLYRMYSAIGVQLPGLVNRRLEEVLEFHASVTSNRLARLKSEMDRLNSDLNEKYEAARILDEKRSTLLNSLVGYGALEDFATLQAQLADAEAVVATLKERFKTALALEGETTALGVERAQIKSRLLDDHRRTDTELDFAIRLVGEAINALYKDRTGQLNIDVTDNGPEFKVFIQGDRGGGIAKAEIFCLDYALFALGLFKTSKSPPFLVHDSHLFDGVDPRQVSAAIELGWTISEVGDAQYIVPLNSDVFYQLEFNSTLEIQACVLDQKLSDLDDTTGLFGFRFD